MLFILATILGGEAVAGNKMITMTLHGVILNPASCQIPGSNIIYIEFGDQLINSKIDGSNYLQNFQIPISCTGSPAGVQMLIKGDSSDIATGVLSTTKANLGIRLLRNGTVQPINSWFDIDYRKPTELQAVPVRKAGTIISGGNFNTIATVLLALP